MRQCEICGSSFMSPRSILCSNTNCSNSVFELPANPFEEIGNLSLESQESGGEELCEIRPEQQRNMELKEEGEARHAVQGHFPSSSDAPGRFQSSGPIEIPKPVASQEAIPSASKIESKSGFCVMCEKLYPCIETHSETELHKNKTKIIASDNKKTLVPANSIECEFTKCLKCKFYIYTKRLNSHNSCYSELACKQFGRGNFYCLMCHDRFETFERLAIHWRRDHFHNNSYIIVLIRGLYTLLPENIDLTQALQFCCKFCQLFTFRNRLECLCASRGRLDSHVIA